MSAGLFWLLKAAGPQPWHRLVPVLADRLDGIAGFAQRLPPQFVDAIVATGRAKVIDAMVRSVGRGQGGHADLRHRLASMGRADMAVGALYFWPWHDQRTMFAAARPDDPAWTGPNGAVTLLLATDDVNRLRGTVVSPFPDLVRHALRAAGTQLTRAEQLRGLLSIVTASGPSAIADLNPALGAAPDELARLVAEAEGTAGAIDELRDRALPDDLALRAELDWELILAAHRAEPFDDAAVLLLAVRPDCPEDVLVALFATHPLAVAKVARATPALLAAPLPAKGAAAVAKFRADAAVKAGLPVLRALPGPVVLEALHRQKVGPDELRSLVADRLGTDVSRWRALRANLKAHKGSIVDLLESDLGAKPGPWPDAKPMPDINERKTLSGVRAAFVTLLDAAPAEAHLVLFPHLDAHTIHDLLSRGRWRDEWLDAADSAMRRSISTRRDLDSAVIDRLAADDDPVINNQLFRAKNLSWPTRTRILSRPLDPALKNHLLSYEGGSAAAPFHARDAIDCTDLDVQLHIPRYRLMYGEIPQLRLVVSLWRRHGRAAVDKLIAVTDGPSTFQGRLLSAGVIRKVQESADPDHLEAEVTRGEATSAQLSLLRDATGPTSARMRECHDWNWPAIHDEHAVRPFPDRIMEALASKPGCPQWFTAAYGSLYLAALTRGEPPAELLARLDVDSHAMPSLLAAGKLTWSDLFAYGRPAHEALLVLSAVRDESTEREGLAALRTLIAPALNDNPEAWVLAAHMLPNFTGTIAELLFTAATATS